MANQAGLVYLGGQVEIEKKILKRKISLTYLLFNFQRDFDLATGVTGSSCSSAATRRRQRTTSRKAGRSAGCGREKGKEREEKKKYSLFQIRSVSMKIL